MTAGLGRLGRLRLGYGDPASNAVVRLPDPLPTTPLWVTLGGRDVSRYILADTLTWESAIGRVPTASFTLSGDWTSAPVDTVSQGDYPYPIVVVGYEDTRLFRGQATSRNRASPEIGWTTAITAEGLQALMAGSPVFPDHWSVPEGEYTHYGTGSKPIAAASPVNLYDYVGTLAAITAAAEWFRGETLVIDAPDIPQMEDHLHVRGDALDSVLDGILARCGGGVWWVDADMVLHVRSIPTGTAPPAMFAEWSLLDTFGEGILTPTQVTESSSARGDVAGVYADGRTAHSSRYVTNGLIGPAVMTGVSSAIGSVVEAVARRELKEPGWETTVRVTLPPLSEDQPMPTVGVFTHLDYMGWDDDYLVRGVTAHAVIRGDTLEVAEWTLELGDAPTRSYTREMGEDLVMRKPYEPPEPVMTKQVVNIETSPVDQLMRPGDRAYIYAWAVDGDRKRVALDGGTIRWSILVGESLEDVGTGSTDIGWTLTDGTSTVVYTDDQPLGFASNEIVHNATDDGVYPDVKIAAALEEVG